MTSLLCIWNQSNSHSKTHAVLLSVASPWSLWMQCIYATTFIKAFIIQFASLFINTQQGGLLSLNTFRHTRSLHTLLKRTMPGQCPGSNITLLSTSTLPGDCQRHAATYVHQGYVRSCRDVAELNKVSTVSCNEVSERTLHKSLEFSRETSFHMEKWCSYIMQIISNQVVRTAQSVRLSEF